MFGEALACCTDVCVEKLISLYSLLTWKCKPGPHFRVFLNELGERAKGL